ncbi:MAG: acyclic terpene utilization AtuA family protein [Hyphomonadaceae bacterium]|nr:acyclic terpene utilization AtuA family protein [Hyphomonadaceae bacterium]
MSEKIVRIGGASAFWGDSGVAAPQLVRRGQVDYLMFDYLAEVTLSIMVNARRRDPTKGYAGDFVTVAMAQVLREVKQKGIRVVANAGGMNPSACVAALKALAAEQGVDVRIAHVEGDDLLPQREMLRDVREMFSGAAAPESIVSMNAYLGAVPIAAALRAGADIVVTGRCADSAMALGPLIHEFGWALDDWDRLAAGTLVGHILECGAQATGGLHTDWEKVERWEDIGYPIAECLADGSFVVTKPPGTGGLVTPATVGEQLLYEIGDPAAYIVPDVVCDFRDVRITQQGPDRVHVTGARGRPATRTYKVSATYMDGWRAFGNLTIVGIDAAKKAERTAEAILARTRAMFRDHNFGDYAETSIEILGAEQQYGPHSRVRAAREVVMKLGVKHADRAALELFAREISPAGTSWSPGTTGNFGGGRPDPAPVVRLFSFLIDKGVTAPVVHMDGEITPVDVPRGVADLPAPHALDVASPVPVEPGALTVSRRLIELVWARSGDKGDSANIGVIARDPALLPILRRELTAERVKAYFAHLVEGEVVRYDLPGFHAMNFLMTKALGGGGAASLRNDPLAKGFAQMLLDLEIEAPSSLAI